MRLRRNGHVRRMPTSPYDVAGTMRIDEIIDPAETRVILAEDLNRLANRRVPPPEQRPLAWWPTC